MPNVSKLKIGNNTYTLKDPNTMQSNWNQTDGTAYDYILNKPNLGDAALRGVDTTPTQSSTNLITSGAVYTAIGDINTILESVL